MFQIIRGIFLGCPLAFFFLLPVPLNANTETTTDRTGGFDSIRTLCAKNGLCPIAVFDALCEAMSKKEKGETFGFFGLLTIDPLF